MDLPRFTSGRIGNLEYSHMNEAFDLLDKLRPLTVGDNTSSYARQGFLYAKIGNPVSNGAMEWEEVQAKQAPSIGALVEWETMEGGRKSEASTSADFQPAFVPPPFGGAAQTPLPAGTVALLRSTQRADGKQIWAVVSSVSSGTDVFAARITGNQVWEHDAQNIPWRWTYSWQQVDLRASNGYSWSTFTGAKYGNFGSTNTGWGPAFNGAERLGVSGVGGSGPANASERPAAIENGVVVAMQLLSPLNGIMWFSMPNGLIITCGNTP